MQGSLQSGCSSVLTFCCDCEGCFCLGCRICQLSLSLPVGNGSKLPSSSSRRHTQVGRIHHLDKALLCLALAQGQAYSAGMGHHMATDRLPAWQQLISMRRRLGSWEAGTAHLGSCTNTQPPEGSDMTWLVSTTAQLNSSAICMLHKLEHNLQVSSWPWRQLYAASTGPCLAQTAHQDVQLHLAISQLPSTCEVHAKVAHDAVHNDLCDAC